MTILLFLAVLVVLILVHELGHFLIAKKAGIRVDEQVQRRDGVANRVLPNAVGSDHRGNLKEHLRPTRQTSSV